MKRIALFGGSFDPVHKGHLKAAQGILLREFCDEVWFLPCKEHPFKKAGLSPVKHRLAMLSLALKGLKGLELKDFDCGEKSTGFTVDLVKRLKKKFPEKEFSLVIGSGLLEEFWEWRQPELLLRMVPLLVVPVKGFKGIPPSFKGARVLVLAGFQAEDISSSSIREMARGNESISGLVGRAVEEYIKKNRLYR